MASLVQYGRYGAINTPDIETNIFYVIMFTSEAHTLQDKTTFDGQMITAGKVVAKAQYICSIQKALIIFGIISPTETYHSANMYNT